MKCTRCGGEIRREKCQKCGYEWPAFRPEMAQDVVAFIQAMFVVADDEDGKPVRMRLQPFQQEALRSLFPLKNGGNPVAINALFSQPKKQGKTTLAAAIMQYIATRRHGAEVYILANSKDQAQSVCFDKIKYSMAHHPYWKEHAYIPERGSQIEIPALGSFIKAMAQRNWGANEGGNPDGVLVDEAAAFVGDGARKSFDALVISPQKAGRGVRLITSYAGFTGQSELLEDYWNLALEGQLVHDGLPIRMNDRAALWSFIDQGEEAWRMPWMAGPGFEQWLASIQTDPSPSAWLRFAMNEWASSEQRFVDVSAWDALRADVGLRPPGEEDRSFILGVDAATKRDCTALVAASYDELVQRVELPHTRIWVPDGQKPLDLQDTVGEEVLRLWRLYPGQIVKVVYDPYQMMTLATMLEKEGVKMEEFTQTSRRTQADTHFRDLIQGQRLVHDGNADLREHVRNAIGIENAKGVRIAKEKSSMKVDAAVAASMAVRAAVDLVEDDTVEMSGENPFFPV